MSPAKSELKPKTPFSKRLKKIIKDESFRSFESKCSLPNGAVRAYYNGRQPQFDALVSICMATGCSADWLLLGKGEPFPEGK